MEFLIVLLVLLTIITLVGHGIWVLIRTIIRLLFISDGSSTEPRVTRVFDTSRPATDDLTATERQLARFYGEGKVNDYTFERVMNAIRAERLGWSVRDVTSAPVTQPVAPPVTQPVASASPIET